jgi:signal transduction histidine kinase
MRAKQSSIASGIFSRSGTLTAHIPIPTSAATLLRVVAVRGSTPVERAKAIYSKPVQDDAGVAEREGLLHDSRNLIGALGLYCDLLSLPGVLKAEHLHYAVELRLLGTRSAALMERLTLSWTILKRTAKTERADEVVKRCSEPCTLIGSARVQPVSLRKVVESCSGLLSQVAGGRAIELTYGPSSSLTILARQEDVERILLNLVRNAAAALDARGTPVRTKVCESGDPVKDHALGAIRIGIGLLQNRVGSPKSWPFRRVKLIVEDSGCGMVPEQLDRLLNSGSSPAHSGHGIGFCVVRELVAAGDGDLRIMSELGVGTRVQIEWPVASVGKLCIAGVGAISSRSGAMEGAWPIC